MTGNMLGGRWDKMKGQRGAWKFQVAVTSTSIELQDLLLQL